jgi:high-affinity nickel-transport protein
MCLLDTTDGALMMTLYTSTALARDQIAVLYYSIVLTVITIVVAIVIGTIQLLSLILNIAEPKGRLWDGVAVAEDYYDVIGGAICASFVLFGGISILMYKPWRRHIDHRRQNFQEQPGGQGAERDALLMDAAEPGPWERYEEGLEEDTSLLRPEGENVEP